MNTGTCGESRQECGRTGKEKAKRNESVGDMQDENQAIAKGPVEVIDVEAREVRDAAPAIEGSREAERRSDAGA